MNCTEKLKILRDKVNWKIEKERRGLLNQLYPLFGQWTGPLPNLRDIFRTEEIDWLLIESEPSELAPLVEFVVKTGYKDEPDVDKNVRKLELHRTTVVHYAARIQFIDINRQFVRDLFRIYVRFDMNYIDEKGVTHFDVACRFGCDDVVEKFLELGQDPNSLARKSDQLSPLHYAVACHLQRTTELLLRSGADPNWAPSCGTTPLHCCLLFRSQYEDEIFSFLKIFFDLNDELNQQVKIDSLVKKQGRTPLHFAVYFGLDKVAELLLRRGANPNLAEVCDEVNQVVQVDVRDKRNVRPLRRALVNRNKKMIELLLRWGADPNSVDVHGMTPLHMICDGAYDEEVAVSFLKIIFEVADDKHQLVQVDAQDMRSWTPLELAVKNRQPLVVDVLLDHGADPSSLVFCPESYFEVVVWGPCSLEKMSSVLMIIEILEKRGYELDLRNTLLKIKTLLECKSVEESNLEYWPVGMDFVSKAKEIMIRSNDDNDDENDNEAAREAKELLDRSSLSLYDFLQLRPKEAEKLVTYVDYLKLARSEKFKNLPDFTMRCSDIVSQIMLKGFCRRRALTSFMELTRNQLPILCCEKIINLLNDEDFFEICLAADIVAIQDT